MLSVFNPVSNFDWFCLGFVTVNLIALAVCWSILTYLNNLTVITDKQLELGYTVERLNQGAWLGVVLWLAVIIGGYHFPRYAQAYLASINP